VGIFPTCCNRVSIPVPYALLDVKDRFPVLWIKAWPHDVSVFGLNVDKSSVRKGCGEIGVFL
jgi:hypothetical protein